MRSKRIIYYMNEAAAREHGYSESEIPAAVGYYIVDLDPPEVPGGEWLQFDASGPYDTHDEAEKFLFPKPKNSSKGTRDLS